MSRLIWLALGVLAFLPEGDAGAAWIRWTKVDLGWQDRTGNVVEISGRRNRFPASAVFHRGRLYPDLTGVRVLERHETGSGVLVRTDQTEAEAEAFLGAQERKETAIQLYRYGPRGTRSPAGELRRPGTSFKGRVLSEAEAEAMKADVFGILPPAESGVTK